jgi:alanine dehydrogenase
MPGAAARTATLALAEATLPYLLKLAADGEAALNADAGFAAGLNVAGGRIVHAGLATDLASGTAALKS